MLNPVVRILPYIEYGFCQEEDTMARIFSKLSDVRMTTTIAATVIAGIVTVVAAIVFAVYVNLTSGTGQIAQDTQRSTMRTSATILAGQLAGLQLKSTRLNSS